MHKPDSVPENSMLLILCDYEIQIDYIISARE